MSELIASRPVTDGQGSELDQGIGGGVDLLERCGWTVVWLGIVLAGIDSSNNWLSSPWEAWLPAAGIALGIVGGAWLWARRRPLSRRAIVVSMSAALAAAFVPAAIAIHTRRFYTTDSSAFNQLAAEALVKGRNPFTASMQGAAQLLHPISQFWTYTANGGHVAQVSYPAGSFLLVAPFIAVGFHHAIADWVNLIGWLAGAVLLAVVLPRRVRWLAGILVLFGGYTGAFTAGGTDALFIPFLIMAVWRWDRFADPTFKGWQRWISPVALGCACAIKQSPWFAVPFVLLGIWIESRRSEDPQWAPALTYAAVVGSVFVAVNLVFVVVSPSAWFGAILLPFRHPLIPDGGGAVSLAIHGVTGGALLWLLSAAGFLAWVALLTAFAAFYPSLKRAWLFALPLVLLIPPRSLESYLVDFIPAAIVAAVCVDDATPSPTTRRGLSMLAVGVPALLGVIALGVGLSSAPLEIAVLGVGTSQHQQVLGYVTIRVHNSTRAPIDPHFMVDLNGGHPGGFWKTRVVSGHLPLGPGDGALVVLTPSTFQWAPSYGSNWIVVAYSVRPNAVSSSPLQHWQIGASS